MSARLLAWRATLLALVAVAMLVGMLKAPWRGESAAHDALRMLSAAVEDGHANDRDMVTEGIPGHVHGHDGSDHQHDAMHLPPVAHGVTSRVANGWHAAHPPKALPESMGRVERPPRLRAPLA
ncbi:hypothetical protein [Ralstonia mannitolilytica]|uniref:hypothetical protein n=1 Tax=Ralstonia mannitolilytica TaxID=105219 RepID=UPI0012FD4261|nr:hypothetical protein [Ralstonia mannitolilytica]